MTNYFIIILLIILIYLLIRYNEGPISFKLNIKNDTLSDPEDPEDIDEDTVKKCEEKCTPTKSLADQLFDEKKINEELRLKYEDKTPAYRYSTTDRYIIDTGVEPVADDKLAFKMKESGGRALEAADSRSLYGKNSLLPFIEEELEEHANSYGWWDDDENLEEAF
jgi:hypothetical protein